MKTLFFIFSLIISGNVVSQNTVEAELLELNYQGSSDPDNIFIFQDNIYFTATDGVQGRELWKIENEKPVLILELIEGEAGTFDDNSLFLPTEEFIYFTTLNGNKLWKTNGTQGGTEIIIDGPYSNSPSILSLFEFNSQVFFSYNDNIHGHELWKTNGSVSGTIMVKDIDPGSNSSSVSDFFIFNNNLYFTAYDSLHGREIWKTDGNESGTILLKDINQLHLNGVLQGNDFLVMNNHFYFYGNTNSYGAELWRSDGTEEGTQLFKDIIPGINSSSDVLFGAVGNGYFVFRAYDVNSGFELWKSNGTEEGTTLLKEINPNGDGIPNSSWGGGEFVSYNGKVYFKATQPQNKLWVTDGTELGTYQFLDLNPGGHEDYDDFKIIDGKLYFFNCRNIIQVEGDLTQIFVNIEDCGITQYQPLLDKVYFENEFNIVHGDEIWESKINNEDMKVIDINRRQSSKPRNFASLDDEIVFFGINYTGGEVLMISDGTQQGTKSILNNPPFAVENNYAALLFKAGNNLFFKARAGQNNWELYKTDGTPQGTGLVKDLTGNGSAGLVRELYANYNDILYFVGNDILTGTELYRSDGTEEGTYKVIDLVPESGSGPFIYSFGVHQDHLYFSGGLGTWENFIPTIWKTNGTTDGTEQVLQFQQGVWADRPFILASIGENIFVYKNNDPNSYSLYVYNSIQDNLQLLKNFDHHTMGGIEMSGIEFNGKFYFIDHSYNNNLYVSDGTVNGTYMVNEDSQFTSRVFDLFVCGNYLYFRESVDSAASNLWRTDGTSHGTIKLVEDNEDYNEYINNFTCYNSNVLFTKGISWSNTLNITNGEPNGLTSVDITLNDNYIFGAYEGISSLFVNQNKLYLTIYNRKNGEELYIAYPEFLLSTDEINEGLINNESNILIYPNPTSFEVNVISNDESKIKQVQLFDLSGRLLELGIFNDSKIKLNLSKFKSGIYLIKVSTEKDNFTKKVILK